MEVVLRNMDGFRGSMHKAVRCDESHDWSVHTIDYPRFKKRLKFFARRRSQIRNMIRSSADQTISEQVLIDLLGPKTTLTARRQIDTSHNEYDKAIHFAGVPLSHNLSMDPHSHVGMSQQQQRQQQQPTPGEYVALHDHDTDPPQCAQSGSTEEGSLSSSASNVHSPLPKRRRTQRSAMRRLSISERNEIIVFLEWEMDKALMFYLSQWQTLLRRLERQQQAQHVSQPTAIGTTTMSSMEHREAYCEELNQPYSSGLFQDYYLDTELGDEILELIAFCVINVVAVQQILVRYDAFARAFEGTPMLNYFMKKVNKHPTSFRKLLFHEELHAIANSFVSGSESFPFVIHFEAQKNMFQEILESLQSTEALSTRNHVSHVDSFMYGLRKWFLVGLFEDRLGLEPAYLTSRGQSLTDEMEQLVLWRKGKSDAIVSKKKSTEKKLSRTQVFHLTLNLLAAFLYCMNYYIVEPSSTLYVNRLGAFDAMSGTLIGMMPLAAFVSSIPYSMWTNKSFRYPFIMSCCMLIIGNVLYSAADLYGHVWVALLGRFVSGLGAPKCIIRRYMADTTPVSLRTGVNAGFGMVVAAGSAMGPAMAIVLNQIDCTTSLFGRTITLNGLTLPGYFMACLWLTFGIVVVMTFEEPDRQGLKEQKELEALASVNGTSDKTSGAMSDDHSSIVSSDSSGVSQQIVDRAWAESNLPEWMIRVGQFSDLITLPVRICLGLLFCKVFTIESLVSATSALSKNRYMWQVQQVGLLGLTNGLLVIPFSILVGRLSMTHQDHVLMKWLVSIGCFGMFLLVDLSDLVATPTRRYNEGHVLAVSPKRYICGYFLSYISIQAFEGVIGSTLSKVIPTALASGTFNSGLLATLVDTFGRACGDLFISAAGFISMRQLMNLLFIPGFVIMLSCLVVIERCRDLLSV